MRQQHKKCFQRRRGRDEIIGFGVREFFRDITATNHGLLQVVLVDVDPLALEGALPVTLQLSASETTSQTCQSCMKSSSSCRAAFVSFARNSSWVIASQYLRGPQRARFSFSSRTSVPSISGSTSVLGDSSANTAQPLSSLCRSC